MIEILTEAMPGQHVYLQADDAADFYRKLGFVEQPMGLRKIVGTYLENQTRR
jgi:NOL1/NOP2/fmu family ribosome biogenesis protein